jgi:hypothetical protein
VLDDARDRTLVDPVEEQEAATHTVTGVAHGIEQGCDGLVAPLGVDQRCPVVLHPPHLGREEGPPDGAPAVLGLEREAPIETAVLGGDGKPNPVTVGQVPGRRDQTGGLEEWVGMSETGGEVIPRLQFALGELARPHDTRLHDGFVLLGRSQINGFVVG